MIGATDAIDEVNLDPMLYQDADFYDDVTGKELPKELTVKAREAEMRQVKAHKLYDKVPVKKCWDETGEAPVGTKWLEINKGDEEEFNIRARLVAQEFTKGKLEKIFAANYAPMGSKESIAINGSDGRHWMGKRMEIQARFYRH